MVLPCASYREGCPYTHQCIDHRLAEGGRAAVSGRGEGANIYSFPVTACLCTCMAYLTGRGVGIHTPLPVRCSLYTYAAAYRRGVWVQPLSPPCKIPYMYAIHIATPPCTNIHMGSVAHSKEGRTRSWHACMAAGFYRGES